MGCINKGYAHSGHMQAMQIASNLREAIDEAPMEACYCQTENIGIYDKTSRLDIEFVKEMNIKSTPFLTNYSQALVM